LTIPLRLTATVATSEEPRFAAKGHTAQLRSAELFVRQMRPSSRKRVNACHRFNMQSIALAMSLWRDSFTRSLRQIAVELDLNRPVKAFDAVLNAVIMELQRTPGAKAKITVEIEAEATNGFEDADVGPVRDNAKQLKFRSEATGFE